MLGGVKASFSHARELWVGKSQNLRLLKFGSNHNPRVKGTSEPLQCHVLSFNGRRILGRQRQGVSAQVSGCQYDFSPHGY